MKTATLGYVRDDGDLAILVTLNNNDESMGDFGFQSLIDQTLYSLRNLHGMGYDIKAFERQDAPDYVELEEQQ